MNQDHPTAEPLSPSSTPRTSPKDRRFVMWLSAGCLGGAFACLLTILGAELQGKLMDAAVALFPMSMAFMTVHQIRMRSGSNFLQSRVLTVWVPMAGLLTFGAGLVCMLWARSIVAASAFMVAAVVGAAALARAENEHDATKPPR